MVARRVTPRKGLQQILRVATRIAQAEGRHDSGLAQARRQRVRGLLDEIIVGRDMRPAHRRHPAVFLPQAEPEVHARFDNVPAVDQQDGRRGRDGP